MWAIGLHWYGFWIALGVAVWFLLVMSDVRVRALISKDQIINLLNASIIGGLVGGRLLHVAVNWHDYAQWVEVLALWQGGLSVLGSIMGVLLVVWGFSWRNHVALLPLLDSIIVYAPLAQAFGRVGCFSAGCCYGCPTSCLIGVPVCIEGAYGMVHPVQLYNVALLVALFLIVRVLTFFPLPAGMITGVALLGLFIIRFVTDFWRGDREWLNVLPWLSVHQWVSLVGILFCAGGVLWFWLRRQREVV
ncbi:MAG: Prolipoprotein diacylglyceryl transferase [candidate division TM6 bacterium GW2011_GWF2_43_17]|nr:MAG: Prolipoprotein diacylglyceryl transferase [candidate division TM6 bacterium GW2011_GWF2_43_17]